MRNKYLIKVMALGSLFAGASILGSCMDDSSLNRPIGQVSKEDFEGDNYLLGAFFPQMTDFVVSAQENNYQMDENLVGDMYSRYMMFTNDGWSAAKNPPLYVVPTSWYSAPFQDIVPGFYQAWSEVKEQTNGEGIYWAWAQLLRVAVMHRVTDMYGPIPYSKINNKDLYVGYDSQEEVYKHMFEDLDYAISTLTDYIVANPGAAPMKKYDNAYEGDFTKWVKFANSLKLRLAVRIRFSNPTLAKQKAEEAVGHMIGLITSNADNASYYYAKGNPLNVMWDAYGDARVCADILTYMQGYKDPRQTKYFRKITSDTWGDITYAGMRSGINITLQADARKFSSPAVAKADRLMWMNAAEVAFLRSEGALAGWNMGGTAQSFYEEGIKLSFGQWGVSGADTYLADGTSTQANYTNPSSITSGPSTNAVSTITIKWNDGASSEEKLERIITQKWIALWPLGQEAWSEMRRTGYPKVFDLVETPKYPVQIPNRLPFSYNEYTTNKANVEAAVTLLGGADTYATKLWWQRN